MIKKNKIIIAAILLILAAVAVHFIAPEFNSNIAAQLSYNPSPSSRSYSTSESPPILITYLNIESMLSRNSIVQALPDSAVILLKFYNFDSGERAWEKSYVMTRGSVKEGTASADLIILLHSKYLSELTDRNFCSVIQEAKANGDFGTEMRISLISFMWRYRSMMSYKSCFGF